MKHILMNSKTLAANPCALTAKALEAYHLLNADEIETFDKSGALPTRVIEPITEQGFDECALSAAVRIVHEAY